MDKSKRATFTNNNFGPGDSVNNNNGFEPFTFTNNNFGGGVVNNNNLAPGQSVTNNNFGQAGTTFINNNTDESIQPIFVIQNGRKVITSYNIIRNGQLFKKVPNPFILIQDKLVDLNDVINLN